MFECIIDQFDKHVQRWGFSFAKCYIFAAETIMKSKDQNMCRSRFPRPMTTFESRERLWRCRIGTVDQEECHAQENYSVAVGANTCMTSEILNQISNLKSRVKVR